MYGLRKNPDEPLDARILEVTTFHERFVLDPAERANAIGDDLLLSEHRFYHRCDR